MFSEESAQPFLPSTPSPSPFNPSSAFNQQPSTSTPFFTTKSLLKVPMPNIFLPLPNQMMSHPDAGLSNTIVENGEPRIIFEVGALYWCA